MVTGTTAACGCSVLDAAAFAVSGECFFPFLLRRLRGVDGVDAAGERSPGASGVTEETDSVLTETMVKKDAIEAAERLVMQLRSGGVGGWMDG